VLKLSTGTEFSRETGEIPALLTSLECMIMLVITLSATAWMVLIIDSWRLSEKVLAHPETGVFSGYSTACGAPI
jgi:hypothetical protein